jgi:hypothetical protein
MRTRFNRLLTLSLLAVTSAALAAPVAQAVCTRNPCAGTPSDVLDCDRDGFSDREECLGLQVAAGAGLDAPSCTNLAADRTACVDPAAPDLFVVFKKASPSVYDELGLSNAAAFALVTQGGTAGLPLRLHVLDPIQVILPGVPQPASVTRRQAALRVFEVRTPASLACPVTSPLGSLNGVTATNNAGIAQIFTQRIVDHVDCVYDSVDPRIPDADRLANKIAMVKHTTSHELAHGLRGAPESVERFGGHHYRAATGCVLDQSTTYTTRGGVAFATPTAFCGPDRTAILDGQTSLGPVHCSDSDNLLDLDGFVQSCLATGP